MTTKQLSLLHVEDDSLWQTVINTALRGIPGVAQAQTASSVREGLAMAATLRPDVVLLDLCLPDGDGVDLARELALLDWPPRILLLTVRQDSAALHAASEPHVAGLLTKSGDLVGQLPRALATVAAGGKYYPPEIRAALRRFRADPQAFFKLLSPHQIALLPYFARAESDAEIGAVLGISEHTVKSHRQCVMRKLDLHNAARLTHWAISHGFGSIQLPVPSAQCQVPSAKCQVPSAKCQVPNLTSA